MAVYTHISTVINADKEEEYTLKTEGGAVVRFSAHPTKPWNWKCAVGGGATARDANRIVEEFMARLRRKEDAFAAPYVV